MRTFCLTTLAILGYASAALAVPITPTFDTFGDLPGATFGGTGIPTDPVAITTIIVGGDTITLGMSAHARFANPTVTDDGLGTYTAATGSNFGDPTFGTMPSADLGATWNVGSFIDIAGGGTFDDYSFEFVYDFDPGVATDESLHGLLDLNAGIVAGMGPPLGTLTHFESSENLLFPFLATPTPGVIAPPTPGAFNPNALGEYTIALVAKDSGGTEIGRSAIRVLAVPEPSSMFLLASGALGLCGYTRRKRRQSDA